MGKCFLILEGFVCRCVIGYWGEICLGMFIILLYNKYVFNILWVIRVSVIYLIVFWKGFLIVNKKKDVWKINFNMFNCG